MKINKTPSFYFSHFFSAHHLLHPVTSVRTTIFGSVSFFFFFFIFALKKIRIPSENPQFQPLFLNLFLFSRFFLRLVIPILAKEKGFSSALFSNFSRFFPLIFGSFLLHFWREKWEKLENSGYFVWLVGYYTGSSRQRALGSVSRKIERKYASVESELPGISEVVELKSVIWNFLKSNLENRLNKNYFWKNLNFWIISKILKKLNFWIFSRIKKINLRKIEGSEKNY